MNSENGCVNVKTLPAKVSKRLLEGGQQHTQHLFLGYHSGAHSPYIPSGVGCYSIVFFCVQALKMLKCSLGGTLLIAVVASIFFTDAVQADRSLAVAAPGGACGTVAGTETSCPSGQCCSTYFWCGVTDEHCDAGCHTEYGECASGNDDGGGSGSSTGDAPPGMDPCPAGEFMSCATHVVTEGQYSYLIATDHGMTVDDLVEMNGLGSDGSLIFPLQLLLVKPCYCVKPHSRRLTEQHHLRSAHTDVVDDEEPHGERRLADGWCVSSMIDSYVNIFGSLVELNPIGLISGAIGLATNINGCQATSEDVLSSYMLAKVTRASILETYTVRLQANIETALVSIGSGGGYFEMKTNYKRPEANVPRYADLPSLTTLLTVHQNAIETEMRVILTSTDIEPWEMRDMMVLLAKGVATVLSIWQERADLTRCDSIVNNYKADVAAMCGIGQPCNPYNTAQGRASCDHDDYDVRAKQMAIGGYAAFQPICDSMNWVDRLHHDHPEYLVPSC